MAIVLIVEDDAFLRMAAASFIEDAGFETLQASNADRAILLLEARDDIRIVFTDIDMPGSMDGLKLAEAVRGRWPPIEIIITSGKYSLAPFEMPDRGVFFSKPYVERDIVTTMQRMVRRCAVGRQRMSGANAFSYEQTVVLRRAVAIVLAGVQRCDHREIPI